MFSAARPYLVSGSIDLCSSSISMISCFESMFYGCLLSAVFAEGPIVVGMLVIIPADFRILSGRDPLSGIGHLILSKH